jgi:tRNA-(ms[2]io[6]A)-hydroxylase
LTNFGLYWLLCEERYGREATVARLQELAAVEVQALSGVLAHPQEVRMHSVGVDVAGSPAPARGVEG